MLFDMVLLAVGFACIARGGDLFVDSSVHIGRVFRIPRFVIGGTLESSHHHARTCCVCDSEHIGRLWYRSWERDWIVHLQHRASCRHSRFDCAGQR